RGAEGAGAPDEPAVLGGPRELCADDGVEDEVAEGAVSLPALVPLLRDDARRPSAGLQPRERLEPFDPAEAVTPATGCLGGREVAAEDGSRLRVEAERRQPPARFVRRQAAASS